MEFLAVGHWYDVNWFNSEIEARHTRQFAAKQTESPHRRASTLCCHPYNPCRSSASPFVRDKATVRSTHVGIKLSLTPSTFSPFPFLDEIAPVRQLASLTACTIRNPVWVTRMFLDVMLRVSWVLELSCGNAAHCRTCGKSSPPISLHIFNNHYPCWKFLRARAIFSDFDICFSLAELKQFRVEVLIGRRSPNRQTHHRSVPWFVSQAANL